MTPAGSGRSMFLAFHLPTDLVGRVRSGLGDLPDRVDAAWTRPAGWHVTLAWLDRLDDDLPDRVAAVAGEVVASRPCRGEAVVDRAVRLGRAVGLRVDLPDAALDLHARLVAALDDALGDDLSERARRGLGRRLRPHLTLARVRRGDDPDRLRAAVARQWERPVTWPLEEVALLASHPGDGPAYYHPRATWSLPG